MALSRRHAVESTVIGRYTDSGKLHITYHGQTCAYVDMDFLESGFPQWEFDAEWLPRRSAACIEPVLESPADTDRLLLDHAGAAQPLLPRVDRPPVRPRGPGGERRQAPDRGGTRCPERRRRAAARSWAPKRGLAFAQALLPDLLGHRRLPHGRVHHRRGGAPRGGRGRRFRAHRRGGQLLLAQHPVPPGEQPGRQVQGGAAGARLPGAAGDSAWPTASRCCPARTACTWTGISPAGTGNPQSVRARDHAVRHHLRRPGRRSGRQHGRQDRGRPRVRVRVHARRAGRLRVLRPFRVRRTQRPAGPDGGVQPDLPRGQPGGRAGAGRVGARGLPRRPRGASGHGGHGGEPRVAGGCPPVAGRGREPA